MNLRIDETRPIWELPSGINLDAPAVKKASPFPNDTIQESQEAKWAWGYISPEIAASMLGPKYSMESTQHAHHKLEAPQFNAGKFAAVNEELEQHLIPKVTDKEASTDTNLKETALLLLYIACMKAHQSNREEASTITFDSLQKRQETNRQMMGDYFNKLDETIARNKANNVLGWVNWALWGGLAAAGVASIALSIATAGAALPTVLVIANAALGVGSGSVTITQGVLDYQNNTDTGAMKEMETERYVNSAKIREGMDEMKESMQVVAQTWEELSQVLENLYHASTAK